MYYKIKNFEVTLPAGQKSVTLDKFNKTFWGNDTKVLGFILIGQYQTDPITKVLTGKNNGIRNFCLNIQQDNLTLAQSIPLQQLDYTGEVNLQEKQYFKYDLPVNNYENSTIANIFHNVDATTDDTTFIIGVVFEC